MSEQTSLRKWAIENKVWEPKAWEKFLKDDIVPFYKDAYTLWKIYEFLRNIENEYRGRTLADMKGELYDKIVTAIYGGIGPNKDPNKSFAKFMYDTFGIQVVGAKGFEDSVKMYEEYGDGVGVVLNEKGWVENNIPSLIDVLVEIINLLGWEKSKMKPKKIGLIGDEDDWDIPEVPDPITLLPGKGEIPDKLINLVNRFRQRAFDLSIGKNPFTTFAFYVREIPLPVLAEFLNLNLNDGRDMNKLMKLVYLLDMMAYSMIDLSWIKLPSKSKDIILTTYHGNDSLEYLIIKMGQALVDIDPLAKDTFESMANETIRKHGNALNRKKYVEFLHILEDQILNYNRFTGTLFIDQGKIIGIRCGYNYYNCNNSKHYNYDDFSLKKPINIYEFLVDITPFVCGGIIDIEISEKKVINYIISNEKLAKEFITKVIKGAGKT